MKQHELPHEDGVWPNDEPTTGYDPYYDPNFILDVPSLRRMFETTDNTEWSNFFKKVLEELQHHNRH